VLLFNICMLAGHAAAPYTHESVLLLRNRHFLKILNAVPAGEDAVYVDAHNPSWRPVTASTRATPLPQTPKDEPAGVYSARGVLLPGRGCASSNDRACARLVSCVVFVIPNS
jgi:hypothetical protein